MAMKSTVVEKQSEQSQTGLTDSAELAQALIRCAGTGIYIVRDGRFIYVNSLFEELTGYTQEELLSTYSLNLVHPEDRELVRRKAIESLKKPQSSPPFEYRFIRKNGKLMWVLERVTCTQYRGKRATVGSFIDITERKGAEEALRGSEEKYRLLVENANEAIIVIQGGTLKFANPQATELSGYSKDELLSKLFTEFVHPDDREIAAKYYLATLQSEEVPRGVLLRIVAKDGNTLWAEVNTVLITWEGAPSALALLTNVTERKQAEETLRKSEERYRTILDEMEDSYFEVDLAGNYTLVNDSNCRALGYSREEMMGMTYRAIIPEQDVDSVYKAFNRVYHTGEPVKNLSWSAVRKDGSIASAELSAFPLRNEQGDIIGFRGVGCDVTQRKQAEAEFKAQKELIDRILANMPSGVLVVGRDLQIVLANKAFYDTFKMKMGEAEGRQVKDVIPMSDLSKVISIALTDRKAQLGLEFRYKVATVERILVAHAIPMGGREVLLFLHDVTDDRQRQERLYFTDRLASIGEMTSGIAHELNNPLTSVIAFSQLLMDGDFSDDAKEDLACIHSEAQRAAEIVKNLLTFARKHEPVRQLTQINKLVEDMLKLRAYELRVNNIQVNTHFTPELPEIMVDYFQMQQVFLNIILNAETAMIQGHNQGTLTIKTERVDSIIRISLTDDGPGIAEENLSRIFDPFFTTKEVGSGTGLGLSICYGIVAGHRGNIYARSQPDKGTTFVVELPITAAG